MSAALWCAKPEGPSQLDRTLGDYLREEQPSPLAQCTIETAPLPSWDALDDRTGQFPGGAP
jgi:hypothetical protein